MAALASKRAVLAYFLGAGAICFGQFSSNIQGVVQDQTQSAVPHATVKLRSLSTDVTLTASSNDSGVYRFSSLQPGNDDLAVEAPGFQSQPLHLTLQTSQTADVNVSLTVAGAAATVEVVAAAP